MNLTFPILMVTAVLLTGCASKFSCGAPAGQSCRSISEIYELREQGALPHQQGKTASGQQPSRPASNQDLWWQDDTVYPESPTTPVMHPAVSGITSVEPGDPLLSRPRVLRVWIGPWEDRDDLHDEQFVYLRLDRGNWLLTGGDAGRGGTLMGSLAEQIKKTRRKLARAFEEPSPLGLRELPPSIDELKKLTDRYRLSDLLPWETYDPEQGVYWNRDSVGILVQAIPATGMDDTSLNVLAGIFNQGLKPGTTVQFTLYASPDIDPLLRYWKDARRGEMFQFLAEKRVDYLRKGVWKSLFKNEPQMVRDFRLLISVEIPLESDYLPDGPEVKNLVRVRDSLLGVASSAGIPAKPCPPDDFLNLMDVLLNPSERARQSLRWDPEGDSLSQQMVSAETALWPGRDSLGLSCGGFEVEVRPMSVRQFPEAWAGWSMSNLIGDLYSPLLRVPCPFMYTVTAQILDRVSMTSRARMKTTRATQMAGGPLGKYVPAWSKREKDWKFVSKALEDGHTMVNMHWQGMLFPQESEADFAEQRFKAVFESRGWQMQRDRFMALPAVLSALPMSAGPAAIKALQDMGRLRTRVSWTAVNTAPVIAEWKGTGSPLLMLTGRRGQIQMIDPFDNDKGNYNIAVAAASGAGKSFFTQEMITSTLGTGGRVWTVDSGRSYENSCKLFKGDFLEFGQDTKVCMNPFTRITTPAHLEENIPVLSVLIEEMATANNQGLNARQRSFVEKAISAVWADWGPDTTVTKLAKWLNAQGDQAAQIISQMLHSYTADGVFARFFEGKANIDWSNPFIALELGELDGKPALRNVILMLLITGITESMYLSNRSQRKVCIIDEAWKLMSGGSTGQFIETGYRTVRKFYGGFTTITQAVGDYYKSPVSKAALDNSDWMFLLRQKPSTLQDAIKNGQISVNGGLEALLKSLDTQHGLFSEIAVMGPGGTSVGRLIVDPFSEKLYSTQAREFQAIRDMQAQGMTLVQAIERLAQAGGR